MVQAEVVTTCLRERCFAYITVCPLIMAVALLLGGCAGMDPFPSGPDSHPDCDRGVLARNVIVIVPHPDDEILGFGGVIYRALRDGATVLVILVTNGDADGDGCYIWRNGCPRDSCPGSPNTRDEAESYGRLRLQESERALAVLGLDASHVIKLGYPDARLRYMWINPDVICAGNTNRDVSLTGKSFTGSHLSDDLATVLAAHKRATLFTTDREDRHPDHAALELFVEKACRQTGFPDLPERLLTAIIHAPGADENAWPLPFCDWEFQKGRASIDRWRRYQPRELLTAPPGVSRSPLVFWNDAILWKPDRQRGSLLLRAIEEYRTQTGTARKGGEGPEAGYMNWVDWSGFMLGFIKRNELFWHPSLECVDP
jgi:LmbE family N-acetylglucosaminyl deacetylase